MGYSEYYLSGAAAYLGREKQPSERVNSARGLVEFMVLGENEKMANSTTDFICNEKGLILTNNVHIKILFEYEEEYS